MVVVNLCHAHLLDEISENPHSPPPRRLLLSAAAAYYLERHWTRDPTPAMTSPAPGQQLVPLTSDRMAVRGSASTGIPETGPTEPHCQRPGPDS